MTGTIRIILLYIFGAWRAARSAHKIPVKEQAFCPRYSFLNILILPYTNLGWVFKVCFMQ